MSLREHQGKTYVQCRADNIAILGTPNGGRDEPRQERRPEPQYEDDSEVPF